MNQPHVHDILRRWRTVADSYADSDLGARVFVSEAWVTPAAELAKYVRADELHTTFNFDALMCEWTAESQRNVIDLTLGATGAVGAPPTWVLANHDTTRVVTRYGRPITGARFTPDGMDLESFAGIGSVPEGAPTSPSAAGAPGPRCCWSWRCPVARTSTRATSSAWRRSRTSPRSCCRTRPGSGPATPYAAATAAGCRCRGRAPRPRSGSAPPTTRRGCRSPRAGPALTAEAQDGDPASHLNHYRAALAERRRHPALGDGTLSWNDDVPAGVLSFDREPGFRCVVNFGPDPYALPADAKILVASGDAAARTLGVDEAVWLER